jgi:hypothetical protein
MGINGVKNLALDFSDMSGGKNSRAPKHALPGNEVANTLNAIHLDRGAQRAPGYAGLAATLLSGWSIRGMWNYRHANGTETLVVASQAKLWQVDLENKTWSEIGAGMLTSDTPCYAVNLAGKLWVVNGTDFVKVEDDLSVYRVGIAAPVGASAAVVTGGSLTADKVYGVYVSYARDDGSGRYLYSLPESLGNLTPTGNDLAITITVPDSTDPQVTYKVAWLTDADGSVPYFYGIVANGTSADIEIVDDSDRNADLTMNAESASNQLLPISPDGIYTFDDRLYVWDAGTQTVYWSLKTDINPLDVERFLEANFRTLARTISSVFSVEDDLFFNHAGNGVSVAYGGDMMSVIKHISKDLWFLDTFTPEGRSSVVPYKGQVLGLTNDGFRFFNGKAFSEDLSFNIKPDMTDVYASVGTMTPCAIVNVRAGKRTEYRFSWRNRNYSDSLNNYQLIFNLDFYFDPMKARRTWEVWETGFSHMAIVGQTWYGAQSMADAGHIVSESGVSDINCFDRTGKFNTTTFVKQWYILTRTVINSLDSVCVWGPPYFFSVGSGSVTGNIIIFDANNTKYGFTISGTTLSYAILPAVLPFVMNPQYPVAASDPVAYACRGNSVAIELSHLTDDAEFFMYELQLPKVKEITNNLT